VIFLGNLPADRPVNDTRPEQMTDGSDLLSKIKVSLIWENYSFKNNGLLEILNVTWRGFAFSGQLPACQTEDCSFCWKFDVSGRLEELAGCRAPRRFFSTHIQHMSGRAHSESITDATDSPAKLSTAVLKNH
jgi:hypothetical protein